MRKLLSYTPLALVLFSFAAPIIGFAPSLIPNTGVALATTPPLVPAATSTPAAPLPPIKKVATSTARFSLAIPAIALDAPIIKVGLNDKGEMDVPSGKTRNVGWYKYGAAPGELGSAVLDAHVYAAFEDLDQVQVGDSITVTNADGTKLHFVVEETATTKLEETSAARLFERTDKVRLNLITCAGTYIPSRETYDHRLIVYAVLAD